MLSAVVENANNKIRLQHFIQKIKEGTLKKY